MTSAPGHLTNTVGAVIPALNERDTLPPNVASLLQEDSLQHMVIVDGGSTDGTLEWAQELAQVHPDRVTVTVSPAGRGRQMNHGAKLLHTEWILFHHADSLLPQGAIASISELSSETHWGGFRQQFHPNNWKLKVISALHNTRAQLTGVMYGDQSMFVRRHLFSQLDGFVTEDLEDLKFSEQALNHSPGRLLQQHVLTDSRKFMQMGEWRALGQVAKILWQYNRTGTLAETNFFKPFR